LYASIEDVKRVLGIAPNDTSMEDSLTAALEAAEAYVSRRVSGKFSTASQIVSFYGVAENALLALPAVSPTIVRVTVGSVAGGYELSNWIPEGNQIRLPGLTENGLTFYDQVNVEFTGSLATPPDLREGVAFLAASVYAAPPGSEIQNAIRSERIGDYQYTVDNTVIPGVNVSSSGAANLWELGMRFLYSYFPRRVYVT
jgi:hypothetical protein